MKDALQRMSHQAAPAQMAMAGGHEEHTRVLSEFLAWLEKTQGLTLCLAFKPQYDWYMPALANKQRLANEFIGATKAMPRETFGSEAKP